MLDLHIQIRIPGVGATADAIFRHMGYEGTYDATFSVLKAISKRGPRYHKAVVSALRAIEWTFATLGKWLGKLLDLIDRMMGTQNTLPHYISEVSH